MKVKNIIISLQKEESENINTLIKIINEKKINLIIVDEKNRIQIEDNLYIDILWPSKSKLINENPLNNNSLVFKMQYKEFSMLFTGDIEKIAEENIIKEYNNNFNLLNSSILKVAHHGSNTSSIQRFVDVVNPQIVLIGVGRNNKFGHPNKDVLERFEKKRCKIYRTDLNGEIIIKVLNDNKILLNSYLN